MSNNEYLDKIDEFFLDELKKIKEPKVIEFGVRFGLSTKRIIKFVRKIIMVIYMLLILMIVQKFQIVNIGNFISQETIILNI